MEPNNLRSQLTIKPVQLEHLDQFNGLLRYVFQVTNSNLEESGYDDGEIILSKRPILKKAEVIGWFKDKKLISQICIYPCKVNIHGRIFSMGGLTGVGTYPEYSNMGLMSELIIRGMEIMRDNNQWISFLYPYSIPYYRDKGWEIISDKLTFTIEDTQIPEHADVDGFVERMPVTDDAVKAVYDQFAHQRHGALIRSEQDWEEYWRWENEEERVAGVFFNKEQEASGYLLYWIVNDIFHIKEMVYLDSNARNGLWNFIHAHDSMVDEVEGKIYTNDPLHFYLDDGHIKETIEPYFMGRIIDVENFLSAFPFNSENFTPFHFIVSDPIAKWNNGIFSISRNLDGEIEVGREEIGKPVELSIQTLTTMMMSYRRPKYLFEIGRLKTDKETLKSLDKIIPAEQAYFSDYF